MEAKNVYLEQEYKKGFFDWSLPFLEHMHIENHSASQEIVNAMNERYLEVCAIELKKEGAVQFAYNGFFYDLFESSCEIGWSINIYSNNKDIIFDEDGQLIDEQQIDGGLCTGSARDAVSMAIIVLGVQNMVQES